MLTFLAPKFMKTFDKYLLLNHPFWYIVKLHYILYFTILMWILSFTIGTILQIDITSYSPESVGGTWIFLLSVLAIILFCIWMYHLTIYNNEDHYGKYARWDDVKYLFVFMIGVNLLMSFSYPMQWVVKMRIANTFTDTQLAKQYNALNVAYKYIGNSIEDYQYCGFNIHDNVTYQQAQIDTNSFKNGLILRDLSKYKRFVHFSPNQESYNYNLFGFGGNDKEITSEEFRTNLLNEQEIELAYSKHETDAQKLKAITSYFDVVKLYNNQYDYSYNQYSPQDYLDNYKHYEKNCVAAFPLAFNLKTPIHTNNEIYEAVQESYLPTPDVSYQIHNIYEAKFIRIYLLSKPYFTFLFYFSFFTALFMILFRNNRWQHYLVTAVTVILLSIIIGIISLITLPSAYPTLSILLWIASGILSISYYSKKDKYRVVHVVATNIFYLGLPLMPYFLCEYAHEFFDWYKCSFSDVDDINTRLDCEIKDYTFKNICYYARLFGISGFIVLVMPLYKIFFINQKALPREK